MNYTIETRDDVSGELERIMRAVANPQALNGALGGRLAEDLMGHFHHRQNVGPRNRFGAPSSGFWGEIADAVAPEPPTNDGVVVTIASPEFIQKVYGGTIEADQHLLSIPARTEAYDHSPREFDFLHAIFFRSGAIALVESDRTLVSQSGKKKNRGQFKADREVGGMVWYWLVESVTQRADPDALPSREKLIAGLVETAREFFEGVMG